MARNMTGCWRHLDEEVEERTQVGPGDGRIQGRRSELGVRVDDREVDLVVVGTEVDEQLVDGIEDLGRAGVRAVDDDHAQPAAGGRVR